jgi:hypothetical protein
LNDHEVLLPEHACPPPFGDGKRTFCFGVWGTSYFGDLQTCITGADTEEKLDLFEFAARQVVQPGARAAQIVWSQLLDARARY